MVQGLKDTERRERRAIDVRGIVQGVGFRPFVYALAQRHGLGGWVRNDVDGVRIEVEGPPESLGQFLRGIEAEAPPLAVVESVAWRELSPGPRVARTFRIEPSQDGAQRRALVSADVATCADCLRELFAPADRRYRYPFINCTNCGPRFTITRSVPYDRALTTMAGFAMCAACRREYDDPADRRFHAQPNACPDCGPQVRLQDPRGETIAGPAEAVARAAALLREGAIVAIKGLGGYHLACDPFSQAAVAALRSRKVRQDKPFALMARSVVQARELCHVGPEEATLLESRQRPIVLLWRRAAGAVVDAVAPRQDSLGIMLAYTPLHHLLLTAAGIPLVMTSGNRCDEPIAYRDDEALEQLGGIADAFLTHNRPIHIRCDDSVVGVFGVGSPDRERESAKGRECRADRERESAKVRKCEGDERKSRSDRNRGLSDLPQEPTLPSDPSRSFRDLLSFAGVPASRAQRSQSPKSDYRIPNALFLRRSRGYAPAPLPVRGGFRRPVLACGGELKNTFCLAKEGHAFLSHHIGDLENYETLRSFQEGVEHYSRLFDVRPERVVCDLHPEYLSTKYARELEEAGLPLIAIQHHHAHIASCLADAERPADERVIGVALDGTGYGTDGAIWGGEFLEGSVAEGFRRRAHLEYVSMPGSEAAIREPWRMAVAYLIAAFGLEAAARLPLPIVQEPGPSNIRLLARITEERLNAPLTSSAGRLFDAVAALASLPGTHRTTYEGQAAIELELAARRAALSSVPPYPFRLRQDGELRIVETLPLIAAVVEDLLAGCAPETVALRFHRTMAELVVECCVQLRQAGGPEGVALSGGTFQNMHLLTQVEELLAQRGFRVNTHQRVPANDGGLALGQAVLADWME